MNDLSNIKGLGPKTIEILKNININNMEDLLPLARLDEYLIIEQAIKEHTIDLKRIEGINEHITDKTLENAYNNLKSLGIVENADIDIKKDIYKYKNNYYMQIKENDFIKIGRLLEYSKIIYGSIVKKIKKTKNKVNGGIVV